MTQTDIDHRRLVVDALRGKPDGLLAHFPTGKKFVPIEGEDPKAARKRKRSESRRHGFIDEVVVAIDPGRQGSLASTSPGRCGGGHLHVEIRALRVNIPISKGTLPVKVGDIRKAHEGLPDDAEVMLCIVARGTEAILATLDGMERDGDRLLVRVGLEGDGPDDGDCDDCECSDCECSDCGACDGTGRCGACDGTGCGACDDTGDCRMCDGTGREDGEDDE